MDGHVGSAPTIPVWKTGVCLSTLMPGENGVPCGSCTRLRGFADHCLGCSANGTKRRAQNRSRERRHRCWPGSKGLSYEIGVTNRIRTGTNAVTGRDAAVTSWSPTRCACIANSGWQIANSAESLAIGHWLLAIVYCAGRRWSPWSDSHRRIRVYETRPVAAEAQGLRAEREQPIANGQSPGRQNLPKALWGKNVHVGQGSCWHAGQGGKTSKVAARPEPRPSRIWMLRQGPIGYGRLAIGNCAEGAGVRGRTRTG
jgi:hypothetical protein